MKKKIAATTAETDKMDGKVIVDFVHGNALLFGCRMSSSHSLFVDF